MQKVVSIVIPNFNRAALISETLNSLLAQSYVHWEAIIVDDGSTDDSEKVIREYEERDKRFRYIKRNRLPKGAPTCRNIGVENAKGEYIIFLDSDDILAPYCLMNRIESFKTHSTYDFLVFPTLIFKEKPGDSLMLWNVDNEEDDLMRFLRGDTPWAVQCPIWKKESIDKIGRWNEEALTWQDWEWHIKAIARGCSYKKMNALPDSFVRRDANERISLGDMSSVRFESRLRTFLGIYNLLAENDKLTKSNRYSLANLLFSHAVACAILNYKERLAERFSSKISDLKLVPISVACLQLTYIRSLVGVKRMKLRFVSTFLYHLFYLFLPQYLIKNYSKRDSVPLNKNDLEQVKKSLVIS